jgi:hypothetical protein
MKRLDREGVFKARLVGMGLKPSTETQSVAVWLEFQITAQQDGAEWTDWTAYEDHSIVGYFYIVKKDGTVNEPVVANLVEVIDWNGDPDTIVGDPPDIPVQITVGQETYNGKTTLKVQWLNPVDYQGGVKNATPEEVQQIKKQFGSLLRAAAGAARKGKAPGKPLPKAEEKPSAAVAAADDAPFNPDDPNEGLPF